LPRPQTYANWAAQVPDGFVFAVKASRLITHAKRLWAVDEVWQRFVQHALALGSRLGPILLQFPPTFQRQLDRLAGFLALAREHAPEQPQLRLVFEFRHESWFTDEIYRLLERHGAALCIADSPSYPRRDVRTAAFTYVRFHGRTHLFTSSYSEPELAHEARLMRRFLRDGVDVYAYFNNDARGHAVENARLLHTLLSETPRHRD
jgi:uncharacterized protein YecE (DUF72 family)